MDLLGLRHVRGRPSKGLDIFIPASILVDRAGKVRWTFRPKNYRVRANLDEVIAEARRAARG